MGVGVVAVVAVAVGASKQPLSTIVPQPPERQDTGAKAVLSEPWQQPVAATSGQLLDALCCGIFCPASVINCRVLSAVWCGL